MIEIDLSSQSTFVSVLAPSSSKSIHVHITLASLVWYFEIGDVVQVTIRMEKGQKGSITSIEDEVGMIIKLSSEAGEVFVEVSIFLPFLSLCLIIYSQFESNLGYLKSHVPDPVCLQTHVSLVPAIQTATAHQETALGGTDSQMGQYAAILDGNMKGQQEHLIQLTDEFATIECMGIRWGNEKITGPLRDFALL